MASIPKKTGKPRTTQAGGRARVEARITADQKATLERAAAYTGHTVTEFIVGAIIAASQAVVNEHEVIRLSPAESAAFVAALAKPKKPNANLRKAFEAHRRSVGPR